MATFVALVNRFELTEALCAAASGAGQLRREAERAAKCFRDHILHGNKAPTCSLPMASWTLGFLSTSCLL